MSQSFVSTSHAHETAIGSPPQTIAPQTAGVILRAVTKKYGSFTAVENVNLEIPAGSYCCLLGPSGRGKTSTLRMIAGHEEVSCSLKSIASAHFSVADRQPM